MSNQDICFVLFLLGKKITHVTCLGRKRVIICVCLCLRDVENFWPPSPTREQPALYSCLEPRLDKEKVHLVWKSDQRWRTLTVQLKKKKHFLTFFTFLLSYYLQRKMYFMNFMNWQSNFLFNQNINCKSNIYMFLF